jgi:heme/copper-type cytochrome/quinol oxidase subunit 2
MDKFKKVAFLFLMSFCTAVANAQANNDANANDLMRSNGKIFLVMAIVVSIVIGLLIYVYRLDRKISKLENK